MCAIVCVRVRVRVCVRVRVYLLCARRCSQPLQEIRKRKPVLGLPVPELPVLGLDGRDRDVPAPRAPRRNPP